MRIDKTIRYIIFLTFFLSVAHIQAFADDRQKKARFKWEADFDFYFDNREYNDFSPYESKTFFGASVSPRIGVEIADKHSIMSGIEVQRQFGGDFSNFLTGISLYYNYHDKHHKFHAGVFPREKMNGKYSRAFFSDSLDFFTQVVQGMLYNYTNDRNGWRTDVEAGIDWMGKYSENVRERFMIFSSGEFRKKLFTIGYNAYMYHYASCEAVHGVVDNFLLYPYFRTDFGSSIGIQELSVQAGWLQSFQNDRKKGQGYVFPCGGEISLTVRHWNIYLSNTSYVGDNLQPLYNVADDIGIKYGDDLYFGDRYYSVEGGFYDRLELGWEPNITRFLKLRLSLIAHFYENYCGFQQMATLRVEF